MRACGISEISLSAYTLAMDTLGVKRISMLRLVSAEDDARDPDRLGHRHRSMSRISGCVPGSAFPSVMW